MTAALVATFFLMVAGMGATCAHLSFGRIARNFSTQ